MKWLIITALALTGCATKPLPASRYNQAHITFVWMEPIDLLAKFGVNKPRIQCRNPEGTINQCVIYTYKPTSLDDDLAMYYLGHEVFHATDLNYHQKGIRLK